jgi:hypothetical protein
MCHSLYNSPYMCLGGLYVSHYMCLGGLYMCLTISDYMRHYMCLYVSWGVICVTLYITHPIRVLAHDWSLTRIPCSVLLDLNLTP